MRKSIATASLGGLLEEKLVATAQVGFDGVELSADDLISCPLSPREIGQRASELGLRVDLHQAMHGFEGVRAELLSHNLRKTKHALGISAEIGVDTILLCSNGPAQALDDDDTVVADWLGQVAELAATNGIRVAYEASVEARSAGDIVRSWRIVSTLDHPSLGICLDSRLVVSRPDDPDLLHSIPSEKIFFVRLSGAPRPHRVPWQYDRHHCPAGQDALDLTGMMAYVAEAGYDGPVCLDMGDGSHRSSDAGRVAGDMYRLLVMLEQAGRRRPGTGPVNARVSAYTDEPPRLDAPDEPPQLSGFAFVELEVDPRAEVAAQTILRGMGFVAAGRHRSRPVQLWRHGDARVLVNRCRPGYEAGRPGGASIGAIALTTDDPRNAAPESTRPRPLGGRGEDELTTTAPNGTAVYLCRADPSGASSWLADFEISNDVEAQFVSGISVVDCVGLPQPAFALDGTALLFESAFGLRRAGDEVIGTDGIGGRMAMASEKRRVRLLLNGHTLGGVWSPRDEAYQHVAFACEDIFAAAVQMRSARLPTLSVPANYYDDLAVRTDLDRSTIDSMREFAILYDADDRGGTYLHFCTVTLGRRVYFEVVQRVNGYDGYGSPNAPVRVAAQYRQLLLGGVIA